MFVKERGENFRVIRHWRLGGRLLSNNELGHMIRRREISGLHLYDRETGLHCLLDEVEVPREEAELCGPRHLSLMLTNRCNYHCEYCYVIKGNEDISFSFLEQVCSAAAELQVLDLTLGGGEPTLHPLFEPMVKFVWRNYDFGLSVTTNAFDERSLYAIMGHVSSLRISLDQNGKRLTPQRRQLLERLSQCCSVGVNLLYSSGAHDWFSVTLKELLAIGLRDVLVIPQHDNGRFILSEEDWHQLGELLGGDSGIHFMITEDAQTHLPVHTLETAHQGEYLFAHIDAHGYIHNRSWGPAICRVSSNAEIVSELRKQNPIRRNRDEDLD